MNFELTLPRRILYGANSIEKLGLEARLYGLRGRCMLVTGRRFARRSGYLDKIKGLMESEGFEVEVFDRIEPNPSVKNVEEGVEAARKAKIDFLVAFGGGSVIDAAKMISVAVSLGGSITEYVYPRVVEEPILPIVAAPTTCGTGSEVTRYAVLTTGLRKVTVVGRSLVPRIAILDPTPLRLLPKEYVAYTGLDALTHALEAYFNRNSSIFSDLLAVESTKSITGNLAKAYRGDFESRSILLYASMLAGLAISVTGTTVVHGGGYYLTAKYGLPHGLANALIMLPFLELNFKAQPEKLFNLASILGLEPEDSEDASMKLLSFLARLETDVDIPESLAEIGVPEEDLPRIVEEALSYQRNLLNNPRDLGRREVAQAFKYAYEGRGRYLMKRC